MKVETRDATTLVIRTSHRQKEILFSLLAVSITSIVVLLIYGLPWWMRLGFVACVVCVACVNLSDVEECTVDVQKGWVAIKRKGPLSGERVFRKELDTLIDVEVESLPKKPQYKRIMLVFKDGIHLPLTDTFFTPKVDVPAIAVTISKFVGL